MSFRKISPLGLDCILIIICGVFILSFKSVKAVNSTFFQAIYFIGECNDGVDNDFDGLIDFASDPECTSFDDNSETPDPIPSVTPTPTTNTPIRKLVTTINSPSTIPEQTVSSQAVEQNLLWSPIAKVLGLDKEASELSPIEGIILVVIVFLLLITGFLSIMLIVVYLRDNKNA